MQRKRPCFFSIGAWHGPKITELSFFVSLLVGNKSIGIFTAEKSSNDETSIRISLENGG
jgi:hypothetical protein